ncbi:tyrosine-type recombinase/integrase [Bacteroides heparinolyticus]|uniref:tyrosine-type recombinase/integrase n=1 Tax=Prevotella heparinolytica TaxID=28113 RepID=UPI0035A01694
MSVYVPTPTLFLKIDNKKKSDKMPLWIRFPRIGGKEVKFSFGKRGKTFRFSKEEWDNDNKRPYDTELAIIIDNEFNRIKKAVNKFVINEEEITIDLLRKIVENENVDESRNASFYHFFNKYLVMQEKKGSMSEGTFKSYMTTFRALKSFREEIKVREINAKLINAFDDFLIKRGNKSGDGDVKGSRYNRLRHVRAVINFIEQRQRIEIENPFRRGDVVIPKLEPNGTFLDFDELDKMYKLIRKIKIGTPEYRVLIMYLFSCFTGFRISDVVDIKWKNIDFEKNTFVKEAIKNRVRKKRKLAVPVFELAGKILELATENDIKNVELENNIFLEVKGDINEILRELAAQIGIEKYLTYHSSRRTFATLAILQGADLQILKGYMGHGSSRTTEEYYTLWDSASAAYAASQLSLFQIKDVIKEKKAIKKK